MVIGSGGREHALVEGLTRSASVEAVVCVPGNAGTGRCAENVDRSVDDHDALVALATERTIDLTVVGPEAPLCAGVVDRFNAEGLTVFGPTAAAARIEGDKAYAKHLMKSAHVPTAEARVFKHYDSAREYVATRDTGVVVKASGLAAGKGVFVCDDPANALLVLERLMVDRALGGAADSVIVEELLQGEEVSVFALVQGRTIFMLESAQDHKALGESDTGPNTGGMGALSPSPLATADVLSKVERDVLVPIVDAMRSDGAPYSGVLYAGLMLTAAGPKVLEFNCRFGDPEAQVVLPRLESDLGELLLAVAEGRLDAADVRWRLRSAVCVVMASQGYPGEYATGQTIEGLEEAALLPDVHVYHAGTKTRDERTVTSGGRVLGVTGLGNDIQAAKRRAYEAVERIRFDGAYYRRDIADSAIRASSARHSST
jgi:phosphoribosylamine--glycine ligase